MLVDASMRGMQWTIDLQWVLLKSSLSSQRNESARSGTSGTTVGAGVGRWRDGAQAQRGWLVGASAGVLIAS